MRRLIVGAACSVVAAGCAPPLYGPGSDNVLVPWAVVIIVIVGFVIYASRRD